MALMTRFFTSAKCKAVRSNRSSPVTALKIITGLLSIHLQIAAGRLRLEIAAFSNVFYLKDSVFIKDGVAIIGRNGFWDHQLGDGVTVEQGEKFLAETWGVTVEQIEIGRAHV